MKKYLGNVLTGIVVIAGVVLAFIFGGQSLSDLQWETLKILAIICGASMLYCFVVGEITLNNSQMDKLWSILPIAYVWVIAAKGGMSPRLIVMAVLVTFWGVRLTYNFAKKGAYSIKFWTGEEDYRWVYLRQQKILKNRFVWALFDLFFISIYQNALVLFITLPALAVMESTAAFGVWDIIVASCVLFFIIIELVADAQQMKFQTKKYEMLNAGQKFEELPEPYNKGFNTTGLWGRARHPNYLGEQMIWVSFYFFVVSAGIAKVGVFNWTLAASLILVLLFMGSSMFQENISSKKYSEYANYCRHTSKYVPLWKYKGNK